MKKQVKTLGPPWLKGSKHIHGIPMIMVRMSPSELEGLDNLQGFPFEDPDTGVRAYPALGEIIEIPKIRDLFNIAFSQIKEQGHVSPDIHEAYEIAKQHSLPYRETPEEQRNPYLKALEDKGEGEDKKFAYIPMNLAELLIEFHGKPELSPEGLLSFGWFNELVRGVCTIGGAILGGPLGAGAGNAVGRLFTGNDIKNAAIGGLKMGALSYGAQGIGQAAGLGAATPYTAGFFGGAPNMVASGLGALGVGKAAAGAAGAKSLAAPALAGAALASSGNAAPNPEELAAASGANAPASNGLDNLTKLALIGQTGLSYMGSQQNYKLQKRAAEREQENIERHRRENPNMNWSPVMSKKRVVNPEFFNDTEDERKRGIYRSSPFMDAPGYAKGGSVKSYNKLTLVKGPGKGQDDLIKTSVPDGSWIHDASSTSMLGDGSSEAGAQVLKKLEQQIMNRAPKRLVRAIEKHVSKTSKPVPVWLSKDEVPMPPVPVTVLGGGSNTQGAALLRKMTNNLRKHKTSNGSGLPPKAKNPFDYMKQGRA